MNATAPPTVAIVEDDGILAHLLSEICQAAGCTVIGSAASAGDALAILQDSAPDYLILDFGLNGRRNGLELLTLAKQSNPALFSILITGWDINDIAMRIEYAQPDRILRKPVLPQMLKDLLETTTARRLGPSPEMPPVT